MLNAMLFAFFCQVRYKLGLSDDEEDEIDSADQPRSDQDLCHPLCQCDKCSKWQKVCHVTGRQNTLLPREVLTREVSAG